MKRVSTLLFGAIIVVGMTQIASAAMVQIQLGGVDLAYDGGQVVDAGPANPDALTNATFLVGDTKLGADTTGVTMDLTIPGVDQIPVSGGQVLSDAGGTLNLDLGDGEFLALSLNESTISYIPLTSTVQFVFAGTTSSIDSQNLPYGISLQDPVSISFSTQISQPVSDSGGFLTSFRSAGTGELQAVPEPASMVLLAMGGMGVLMGRRKK